MTYDPSNWPFRNKFLRADVQEFAHLSHLGNNAMIEAAEFALAERAEPWIEAGFYEPCLSG